jgi:hypothetical protein
MAARTSDCGPISASIGNIASTIALSAGPIDLKIPSLRHYLVIEQERRQIVHHERRDDLGGAFLTNIAPPDPLRLDPPGIELALAEVYDGVTLA